MACPICGANCRCRKKGPQGLCCSCHRHKPRGILESVQILQRKDMDDAMVESLELHMRRNENARDGR